MRSIRLEVEVPLDLYEVINRILDKGEYKSLSDFIVMALWEKVLRELQVEDAEHYILESPLA